MKSTHHADRRIVEAKNESRKKGEENLMISFNTFKPKLKYQFKPQKKRVVRQFSPLGMDVNTLLANESHNTRNCQP